MNKKDAQIKPFHKVWYLANSSSDAPLRVHLCSKRKKRIKPKYILL